MTKEKIYQNFLEDPLLIEKNYISSDKVNELRMIDQTGVKLLEVIKLAIDASVDGFGESVAIRKVNKFLNSGQL